LNGQKDPCSLQTLNFLNYKETAIYSEGRDLPSDSKGCAQNDLPHHHALKLRLAKELKIV